MNYLNEMLLWYFLCTHQQNIAPANEKQKSAGSENLYDDIVTHAMTMTVKSSQFHGSLKKVNGTIQNPLANIFIIDSKV